MSDNPLPAKRHPRAQKLIELAFAHFRGDVNDAERYALGQIAVGELADFDEFDPRAEGEEFDPHRTSPPVPLPPDVYGPEPNPAGPPPDPAADERDARRTFRADRLAWLLTDPDAKTYVTHRGVKLKALVIDGEVDLSCLVLNADISAWRCRFMNKVFLCHATVKAIYLDGSNLPELDAEHIHTDANIHLRNGFRSTGVVILLSARIGGDLNCRGGLFTPSNNSFALFADGAKIDGVVFLNNRFHAIGTVRLVGARVGKDVICCDGLFVSKRSGALVLDNAKVGGGLWLQPAETISGYVQLNNVTAHAYIDTPSKLPDEVGLRGFCFERFMPTADISVDVRLAWLAKDRTIDDSYLRSANSRKVMFNPESYEYLAGVYRRMGRRTDARRVLVEMENLLGREYRSRCGRWLWKGWGLLAGYGYWTARPALISAMWIAVLTGVSQWFYVAGGIVPPNRLGHVADTQMVAQDESRSYPTFNAGVYALDVFVPLVDLEQTKYWQPILRQSGNGVFGTPYVGLLATLSMWLSIVAGWVLTTLFAAGLTKSVRE